MSNKVIDLELPTDYFQKDIHDTLGARLAKFDLQKGDILRFHEIDNQGKRTGKFYDKKVTDLHKIHKATKYWSKEDLSTYGIYIFQMELTKSNTD